MKDVDLYLDNSITYDLVNSSSITDKVASYNSVKDEVFLVRKDTNSAPSIDKEQLIYYDADSKKEELYTMILEKLVYNLLKEGKSNEAKTLLKQYEEYTSPLIDRWKKVLSKIVVTEARKASLKKDEIMNESALIKRDGKNYYSKWVALVSGNIFASADNLENLKKELERLNKKENVTFLKL